MMRRTILADAGTGLSLSFAGAGGSSAERGRDDGIGTDDETDDENEFVERLKACEKQYIREEAVAGDDTRIDGPLDPRVVETESRSDGKYAEVETEFGVTRSAEGEPDEHRDYRVSAYYLVSAEETYRTEGTEAEGDPRDGATVDC